MYHPSKLTIEYIVIIRTVIYKKEYNNITINSYYRTSGLINTVCSSTTDGESAVGEVGDDIRRR